MIAIAKAVYRFENICRALLHIPKKFTPQCQRYPCIIWLAVRLKLRMLQHSRTVWYAMAANQSRRTSYRHEGRAKKATARAMMLQQIKCMCWGELEGVLQYEKSEDDE
jgi:hypothetical protein